MNGFVIFLIMLIGFGLVLKTAIEFQKHRSYMFKNIAILKRQRISLIIGLIGAFILFVTLLIWVH